MYNNKGAVPTFKQVDMNQIQQRLSDMVKIVCSQQHDYAVATVCIPINTSLKITEDYGGLQARAPYPILLKACMLFPNILVLYTQ